MRSSSGAGDGVEHVGGGDEQHAGQVEVDLEVVVPERVVLGRVEHLEQGRRGVAPPVAADLVDLVEQEDRVHGPGLDHGPHDAAGLGADVGAAVAADLGLVADAAERDPHELAAQGAGHRLAERGLADAGRADQRDDRRLAAGGDVVVGPSSSLAGSRRAWRSRRSLRTASSSTMRSFTSSRPVWSASSTARASVRSRWSVGAHAPRQLEHGVEPGADPAVLGGLRARALEAADLALDRGRGRRRAGRARPAWSR